MVGRLETRWLERTLDVATGHAEYFYGDYVLDVTAAIARARIRGGISTKAASYCAAPWLMPRLGRMWDRQEPRRGLADLAGARS